MLELRHVSNRSVACVFRSRRVSFQGVVMRIPLVAESESDLGVLRVAVFVGGWRCHGCWAVGSVVAASTSCVGVLSL